MRVKDPVSKRFKWEDLTTFPGNPIYEQRLARMGSYNHNIIQCPLIFDNSAGAYSDLSSDALIIGEGNHRYELAVRADKSDRDFVGLLYRGLTRPEMHKVRREANQRRTIKPAEVFLHRVEEGDREKARIKDAVEAEGWTISYERSTGGLSCTNELEWIWSRDPDALRKSIRSYEIAYGRVGDNAQARVIKGLGVFWILYPTADFERVISGLTQYSVQELYEQGKVYQESNRQTRRTVHGGIAWTLVVEYNKGLRSKKAQLDTITFRVP